MQRLIPVRTVLILHLLIISFTMATPECMAQGKRLHPDVLVYGATPAGIAAALNAALEGHTVLLVTLYRNIGGLATNGLSNTDFHSFEGLTGTFLVFANRVHQYYVDRYGKDSPQVIDGFRGTHGEPHVNRIIFEQMLSEQPAITVKRQTRVQKVSLDPQSHLIQTCEFVDSQQQTIEVTARIFIDATYEGDLMALAGVPYRVGREGRDEYGESLAPEVADDQVQGYNFRFVMTQNPDNRVPLQAPEGYDPEAFVDVLPLLQDGSIETVFCAKKGGLYKAHLPALPNQKHDINDVSRNIVRLSLPQLNNAWPEGDMQTRNEIFATHLRHNVGLLYFIQTDPRVPKKFQDEANSWGWCRDEFQDTNFIPEQLYIREARRMIGMHVYSQKDCQNSPGDARAVFHPDAIAIGEYSLNCHGTDHEGPTIGGKHTGEFYQSTPPYQIPYGVICPKDIRNLLVPGAISASHVSFCALRLEPIWTSFGDAAGVAASLAIQQRIPIQQVKPFEVQKKLHSRGAATVYVSDVLPDHPDFKAVQWWGMLGGFHGLEPQPTGSPRGKFLTGQYFEAYIKHAAQLDHPLDAGIIQRWNKICEEYELPLISTIALKTRGDFIRAAYEILR